MSQLLSYCTNHAKLTFPDPGTTEELPNFTVSSGVLRPDTETVGQRVAHEPSEQQQGTLYYIIVNY